MELWSGGRLVMRFRARPVPVDPPEAPGLGDAVSSPLPQFLHHANVRNYQRRLKEVTSSSERGVLMELLDEELASAKREGWLPLYPMDN
jgi:hypothetical protein